MKLLSKVISKLMRYFFTKEQIVILSSTDEQQAPNSGMDIRSVNNSNLNDVLSFQPSSYLEVFKNFLVLGDQGYYAYFDGQCVHRSWVKSNEQVVYPHWAYPMKLMPNQYFIHYCETAPSARGKGVYPAVLSKIVKDCKDNGEILMSINAKNTASIKGSQKAGFVERERVKVLVIFGIKFIQKQVLES